eukprot:361489-Chlamydomonas_euryale.AAC.1
MQAPLLGMYHWRSEVGMEWLGTVRNGLPFVTAPSPLLDPLCLALLNTGIPFAVPLLVSLTLTLIRPRPVRRSAGFRSWRLPSEGPRPNPRCPQGCCLVDGLPCVAYLPRGLALT